MPIHQTKLMMPNAHADRDVVAPDADAGRDRVASRRRRARSVSDAGDRERELPRRDRRGAQACRAADAASSASDGGPTRIGSFTRSRLRSGFAIFARYMRARPRAELVQHAVARAARGATATIGVSACWSAPNWIARGRARLLARGDDLAGRDRALARCAPRISAPRMRCTQNVHFSITPRARTVTSGLCWSARVVDRLVVVEPVEAADLVRAVVRAEPRADAAVVDHLVEPVGAVRRREHRAHVLAGRVLAVLAQHRLVHDLGAARRLVDVACRSAASASRGRAARPPRRRPGRCSRPDTRSRTQLQPVQIVVSIVIAHCGMLVRSAPAGRAASAARRACSAVNSGLRAIAREVGVERDLAIVPIEARCCVRASVTRRPVGCDLDAARRSRRRPRAR